MTDIPPTPHRILHPEGWAPARGYSNGMVARGSMVFLGGMVGWNSQQQFETDEMLGQIDQCLANIVAVLAEAGGGPQHLVRLTWYVTSKAEYVALLSELGPVYRQHLGRHFPGMAVMEVVSLVEDRAKVEIEATAVIPD